LPPGAATVIPGPKLANPTFVPTCRSAVTVTTPGQLPGDATSLAPSFRVLRRIRHRQPGSPAHAGDDVRVVAETLAEHAHRKDGGVPADSCASRAVVRARTDDSSDVNAVPRTVRDLAVGKQRVGVVAGVHPVAGVARIRIACIAIIGDLDGIDAATASDKVVAGQKLAAFGRAAQIRMIEHRSGVEHGDDDPRVAGRQIPRTRSVDGRHKRAVRRGEPPLAGLRCLVEQRVARNRRPVLATIGHRVLDRRISRQPLQHAVELAPAQGTLEPQRMHPVGDAAREAQGHRLSCRQFANARPRCSRLGAPGGDALLPELHDHAPRFLAGTRLQTGPVGKSRPADHGKAEHCDPTPH